MGRSLVGEERCFGREMVKRGAESLRVGGLCSLFGFSI